MNLSQSEKDLVKRVLRFAEQKGVWLAFSGVASGTFDIKIDHLFVLLEDPLKFEARLNGVSKDFYLAWMKEMETASMCSAKTSKGKPCKNTVYRYAREIGDYDPELKFCETHREPKVP